MTFSWSSLTTGRRTSLSTRLNDNASSNQTIHLYEAGTGARPAELVDGAVSSQRHAKIEQGIRQWRAEHEETDDFQPRIRPRDRSKALCYEDIRLSLVRVEHRATPVLAMDVTLAHHKGVDRKPKP